MAISAADLSQPHQSSAATPAAVYAKVTRRLVPLLFLCYVMAYLDRINIGFAQLQMKSDLGFSDAVYGLGAGIFFVGYFLFEIPSNLLLERIGARKTITRIMVVWGLISAGMAFTHAPWLFYVLRFLLGVFEAGFFPGIILYFTYWYPGAYRTRVTAIFTSAFAVAGVVGGPLSGLIMTEMPGVLGLAGWQWMFILEGLPTTLLGLFVFAYLDDRPETARWLAPEEKALLARNLNAERLDSTSASAHGLASFAAVIRDPKIYLMAFSWFCFICGVYMINFWLPTLIRDMGFTNALDIGLLAAIPYGVAMVGVIANGYHSDHALERRWHCALPAFVGALALVALIPAQGHVVLSFALLSLAAPCIFTTVPLFWSMPSAYLRGSAAAGGIALINSLGLVGGFASPFALGWIKTATGSLALGNWLIAGLLVAGGLVVLLAVRPEMLREARI